MPIMTLRWTTARAWTLLSLGSWDTHSILLTIKSNTMRLMHGTYSSIFVKIWIGEKCTSLECLNLLSTWPSLQKSLIQDFQKFINILWMNLMTKWALKSSFKQKSFLSLQIKTSQLSAPSMQLRYSTHFCKMVKQSFTFYWSNLSN